MSLRSLLTNLKQGVQKGLSGVDTSGSLSNKFWKSKAATNLSDWQKLFDEDKGREFVSSFKRTPTNNRQRLGNSLIDIAGNMTAMGTEGGYQLKKGFQTKDKNLIGKGLIKSGTALLTARGVGMPLQAATYSALPGAISGVGNYIKTKDSKQALNAGVGGAIDFLPKAVPMTAIGSITNPLISKIGVGKNFAGRNALKAGPNVFEGLIMDKATGMETTKESILIDALAPAVFDLAGMTFKSANDARIKAKYKIDETLGTGARKNGKYASLDQLLGKKGKGKTQAMGVMAGIEPYQDEEGKWRVRFNKTKALIGLGVAFGGTKILKNADNAGKNELEDILKAQEVNGGDLVSEARKYKSAEIGGEKTNIPDNQSGRTPQQFVQNPKTEKFYQKSKQVENQQLNQLQSSKATPIQTELNSSKAPSQTNYTTKGTKNRGLVESVQDSNKITSKTKAKVSGTYEVKTNPELMGEAEALLVDGGTIDFKNTKNLDQKVAATIEQARILDAQGDHEAAANLFNNLSEHATELGRGVQAFNLIDKMSPEAISLSAAGKIKKYNLTAKKPIPELTGTQQKQISDAVEAIRNMPKGRERNMAIFELNQKINSFIPSSFADKAITVWKAGLLTSLRTHERNILGNSIMLGSEVSSKPIASAADWLMSKRTGQRTITSTTKGVGEMVSNKTLQQTSDLVTKGYDPTNEIEKFEIKKINWGNNPVEKFLKVVTDKVFNTLSAEDRSFYNTAFANSLYDQAGAAAKNAGKSGDATFIKKLVDKPTEEMLTIATKDANYATFHDKNILSDWATGMKRTMGKTAGGKVASEVLMPFTGVPSSIVGKTVAYSPVGFVKGVADMGNVVIKNIPELQRQAAQEIARGSMGTALFSIGAYLTSKGLMTGQPKDEAERNQWQLEGKQANSVLINGKWRNINSVGPQTLVLLAGGKFYQEMNNPEGSLASYGTGLAQDQLNQTFLQGMMGPLNAIADPNRYGKNYVGNTTSGFVPNIIKDVSKATDSTSRETNNWWEYPMSGIPGLRNTLLPKRDVLGNEIPQEPTGFSAFYDLFNSKTPISNTVVDELARLNNEGSNATPSTLQKTQTINKVKMKLTPQELDMLEQKVGEQLNPALEKLINSRSYQLLSDDKKVKAIDNLVDDVRKGVKKEVGVLGMPDTGYKSSADAPKTLTDKLSLYGKAALEDPKKTVKAIVSGQPIRKVVGDSVILERQNDLAILDSGNKETVVDHIIPLSLGGTNDKSNLQNITTNENIAKAKVEKQILKDLKSGKINEKEAQKRVKDWKNQLDTLPDSATKEILSEMATGGKDDEEVIVYPYGNGTKTVKKTVTMPKLTSNNELNKKIISDYKSDLTDYTNYIMYQFESGAISEEKAGAELERIAAIKKSLSKVTSSSGSKKAKKSSNISQKILKTVKVQVKSPKFNTFEILNNYKKVKAPTIKAPNLKVIDFKTAKLKKGTK